MKPRIIFFGTSQFACRILQELIDEGQNIAAVVSQPDKPVGRRHTIEKTPVHALAEQYGIPVIQPVKLRAEADSILALEPELIVTCAYGQFVPEIILNAPKYGCLNVHPSLLPKYRGGAPVHRAVMNGDKETGVCLMQMVKAMDAGKVYACCRREILPDMTTEELNLVLEEDAALLLRENLPLYLEGKLPGTEQDEAGVVLAPNISREDEMVRFAEEDVHQAYNHIRALIDWPISYGVVNGKRIKFYRARKEEAAHSCETGTVTGFENGGMRIACKGGFVDILELQMEGKNRMSADAFANGAGRSLIGKQFE